MVPKTIIENVESISVILLWVAGSSFLCALAAIAYRILRPRFPIRVNCWFCCKDTTVPYGNRNCWDCPSCDQYNGFTADNDYNKPIPSQYSESLNHPVPAANSSSTFTGGDNDLCDRCNQNQLLKVKQLANFVAYDESHFEAEVEAYKRHLDEVYQLCRSCDFHVQQVLERQDRELWHKLQRGRSPDTTLSDHDSVCSNSIVESMAAPWHACMLRTTSLLCAIVAFLSNILTLGQRNKILFLRLTLFPAGVEAGFRVISGQACIIVVIGFFLAVVAIYVSGKHRLHVVGAGSLFSWLLLFLLHCGGRTQLLPRQQDDLLLRCITATLNLVLMAGSMVFVKQTPVRHITLRKHRRRRRGEGDVSVTETCDSSTSLIGDTDQSYNKVLQPANDNTRCVGDLETITLGSLAEKRQMGVFAVPHSVVNHAKLSPPTSLAESLRHRRQRPLISPARFKAPGRGRERFSIAQNTGQGSVHHAARLFGGSSSSSVRAPSVLSFMAPSTSTLLAPSSVSLYSPSSVSGYAASDISSVFSDVRLADDPDGSCSERSTVSSRCAVGTTTDCASAPVAVPSRQQSFVTASLLGISIAINLLLGLVYFFGFKLLPS